MYYLIIIKELSSGTIDRTITMYDNKDMALRKFHEAFNVIGGGPKRISSILLSDVGCIPQGIDVIVEKNETWVANVNTSSET